jgi:TonB-dependent receptor
MRSILPSLAFAITVTILGLSPAVAQVGGITGTVKDATGAVLPGARVDVQQGPSAVSDAQGQFLISRLPSGNYKLTVTYVGFTPFEGPVTVTAPEIAHVDPVLKVESASQVVTVTADRQLGEVEAINIESTADNIVQVLPSKVITSLPNTNVADAVGRIPSVSLERDEGEGKYVQIRGTEPRLSNLTINGVNVPSPEGNVRNIKMDIIPSGIIEFIEVNKTLSANQDGDAIGGSVDLVTKTASERPTFDFEGQGGYTNIIGGRWLDAFNGTAGQRFGARKQWGFLLGGTYDWNGRGINDLEPAPGVISDSAGTNFPYFASADLRTYKYYRTRYGFAPEVDYVIKPGSSVYLKGLYSDFHDFGDTWVYTPNVGNTLKSVNGTQYTFANNADCTAINQAADVTQPGSNPCQPGSMQYRHYIRRPDQQVWSFLTGARHDLTSNLIVSEFSISRAHNIGGQDFPTARFNGPAASFDAQGNLLTPGVDIGLNTARTYKPQFPVLDGTNIYNPASYVISSYSIPSYGSSQLNFQGAASFAHRYSTHEHYGNFEFGLKIRNAHKTQTENDQFYDNQPGTVTLAQVVGRFSNPTYYDKAYQLGPLSDFSKISNLVLSNLSQLGYDPNASVSSSIPADFDANERVYAGYLMNTIGFGKLTLQTGVRFEATSATYRANALQFDANGNPVLPATSVPGSSSYVNVLPSIQLQYRVQQNTNIRGSFGIGISRPNFSDIVPSKQVDPNTSPYPSIVVGNPALKPTRGNNYDILVEHYFRPVGILQAGFFYKTLSDPIYPTRSRFANSSTQCAQFAICDVLQSINGPSGHITGFEASWEQRLSFLPGLLNGFGVAANYSYTTSRVTFPTGFNAPASDPSLGRTDHPRLQRQAPNNYNLGLTYDKARLSLRFAMSHNDASIYSYFWGPATGVSPNDPVLGLKGPNGDQYLYAHTQYDVQGSVRVGKGFSVVAYGLNLSNEVFGFYQGSTVYPIQREFYHPTFSLGVKWTSAPE